MCTEKVSVIIPTRNRRYTLERVIHTYLQPLVTEIILVDDCGSDDTDQLIQSLKEQHPDITFKFARNSIRRGAAHSRQVGVDLATNKLVMFGEDDAYLRHDYIQTLANKINSNEADIISGRIVYLEKGESENNAQDRFGYGTSGKKLFNENMFCLEQDSYFQGDAQVFFTHALYMSKTKTIKSLGFDDFYNKAHGYREETDTQLLAYTSGYRIKQSNDTICFHFHRSEVPSGGQRINRFIQLRYGIKYTNYMFDKYYNKLPLERSIHVAKIVFALSYFSRLFVQPFFNIIKKIK